MKFSSTRDPSKLYSFEEALFAGYAPDQGLFVPERLPRIDVCTLKGWSKLGYVDLATTILSLFVDEIPREDLHQICKKSFSGFPEEVVPVLRLSEKIFLAELFHGPTFCFKDLGMRAVVNLLDYFADRRQQKVTLVVSTTGDTGPAAVQAVQDANSLRLSILVHYPSGQISDFQRKQLTTVNSSRVQVVAFEGGGDDMDVPIKRIMTAEAPSSKNRRICGVNSYNIGRPLLQMIHFIWAYFRVVEVLGLEPGDPDFTLDIVLPTGAMGNIAGGYMAKQMGVPLGYLCAGVNINDITNTVIQTGVIQKTEEPMQETLSEAINIQLPYNLERLLFYLTHSNHQQIREWYTSLDTSHRVDLNTEWLTKLQSEFRSARVTDGELCSTLKETLKEYMYLADPHTGVAFAAAKQFGYLEKSSQSTVCLLATASPSKFQKSMTVALGSSIWEDYEQDGFPERGKETLRKPEKAPFVYKAVPGDTLEENQVRWEEMSRKLIENL